MVVDHAFTLPMALLWPDQKWPVRVVPVCINTVQSPLPSAARCYKLGEAIGRAVRSWDSDANVLVLGTGGLSHARRRGGQGAPQLPHPDLEHGRRSGGHRRDGLTEAAARRDVTRASGAISGSAATASVATAWCATATTGIG
jgi:hypothetical protein